MTQKAFTLLEVLITLAIILILVGALAGTGQYLRIRSETQLTATTIEIINAALEQYHEQYRAFPFRNRNIDSDLSKADPYNLAQFQLDTGMEITVGTLTEKDGTDQVIWNASSAALYYYLNRYDVSKSILDTLANRMITNVDAMTSQPVKMTMGGVTYDVPRFIDAWGMSLQYEYMDQYAFPKIMSAGPDKVFGTTDDLGNR
ncbi:MAG: prepilin-type N-terminal cleavage/methylation domain-containing protein [Anaerohalosphaeraceae bacterium]